MSVWKELEPFRFPSKYVAVGNAEIIAVSDDYEHTDSICKYNVVEDKWVKLVGSFKDFKNIRAIYNIAVDSDNNKLLILFSDKFADFNMNRFKIGIIELATQQWTFYDADFFYIGAGTTICIHGEFHLFGGLSSGHHYVIKFEEDNKFQEIPVLNAWRNPNTGAGVIYHEDSGKIYFFGGYDGNIYSDSIWCWYPENTEWKKMELTFPTHIDRFGYCYHKQTDCILIFGGAVGGNDMMHREMCDNILIWSLTDMNIRKSNIKCPIKETVDVAIIRSMECELIVFGYIRESLLRYIPVEIVKIILGWYYSDDIHVFTKRSPFYHWKTSLFDILSEDSE